MNEYGEKSVPKPLFLTTNPIRIAMDVTEFGIRYSEEGKWHSKRTSNKETRGSVSIGMWQKRCFTLEIVFWHMNRSAADLIVPDS